MSPPIVPPTGGYSSVQSDVHDTHHISRRRLPEYATHAIQLRSETQMQFSVRRICSLQVLASFSLLNTNNQAVLPRAEVFRVKALKSSAE